jgi:hypothetical protein
MPDPNEIRALKASFQGAIDSAQALEAIKVRVMSLDSGADVSPEDLEELGRVTLAHAVASQALRGLVESMRARHSA